MKIDSVDVSYTSDRMYCPSTGEIIFSSEFEEMDENARALIAYWHGDFLEEPVIKDQELSEAWEAFYEKWKKRRGRKNLWKDVEQFFRDYQNDDWIVIECMYGGIACGPVSTTVYHVVYKDTVVEEDPDYVEDEEEEDDDNEDDNQ